MKKQILSNSVWHQLSFSARHWRVSKWGCGWRWWVFRIDKKVEETIFNAVQKMKVHLFFLTNIPTTERIRTSFPSNRFHRLCYLCYWCYFNILSLAFFSVAKRTAKTITGDYSLYPWWSMTNQLKLSPQRLTASNTIPFDVQLEVIDSSCRHTQKEEGARCCQMFERFWLDIENNSYSCFKGDRTHVVASTHNVWLIFK